jgi:hypothetical protein
MKLLVAGWFSFEQMGVTAGDIIAKDLVCRWLNEAKVKYDVAIAPPFLGGVSWKTVDPDSYTDIAFICGPFGNGWPVTDFLEHFSGKRLIGVNLTMLQNLDEWNPFDILFERDSSVATHPDITFMAPKPEVPVVGLILVHKQKEYGKRSLHEIVDKELETFLTKKEAAVVWIDTALENNKGGLKTPGEIEALIARMDLVITTRLHGTVLALKNGVPVIPVDPIDGGAKISLQVKTIGWPILFSASELNDAILSQAYDYCLSDEGRTKAQQCAESAVEKISELKNRFIQKLQGIHQH